ncbi:hypothetical protein ABKN59_005109 [Abortiporus biennis]
MFFGEETLTHKALFYGSYGQAVRLSTPRHDVGLQYIPILPTRTRHIFVTEITPNTKTWHHIVSFLDSQRMSLSYYHRAFQK